jgi:peptidyl-prolyl cis-trans isomerase SurA
MKAYKRAPELRPEEWVAELEGEGVEVSVVEKKLLAEAVEERGWKWQAGYVSPLRTDPNFGASFSHVVEIVPPETKQLKEARGYVIADYQDHLEKEWVKELTEEYEVLVNEDLLMSLVQK